MLHDGYRGEGGLEVSSIPGTSGRGASGIVRARSGPVLASMTLAGVPSDVARLQTHLTELERGLGGDEGIRTSDPPACKLESAPIRGGSRSAGRARNSTSRLRFLLGNTLPLASLSYGGFRSFTLVTARGRHGGTAKARRRAHSVTAPDSRKKRLARHAIIAGRNVTAPMQARIMSRSFTPNARVTTATSNPRSTTFIGNYIGIDGGQFRVHAVWTDPRSVATSAGSAANDVFTAFRRTSR